MTRAANDSPVDLQPNRDVNHYLQETLSQQEDSRIEFKNEGQAKATFDLDHILKNDKERIHYKNSKINVPQMKQTLHGLTKSGSIDSPSKRATDNNSAILAA